MLGCAGVAGLQLKLQAEVGVPVIDGVSVAVSLCEDLVHHKAHPRSKVGLPLPSSAIFSQGSRPTKGI